MLAPPAADRHRRDVPGPAGRAGPVRLHRPGRRGRHHRDRRPGRGRRAAAPGRHRARAGQGARPARPRRRAQPRAGGRRHRVRAGGPAPDPPAGQGADRRRRARVLRRAWRRTSSGRQPVPVRRLARRARPARAAVRRAGRRRRGRRARCSAGGSLRDALRDLLRRGPRDGRGLDDLQARARRMRREALRRGNLDGAVTRAQQLLDQALAAERDELRRPRRRRRPVRRGDAGQPAAVDRAGGRGAVRLRLGQRRGAARRTSRSSTGCAARWSSSGSPGMKQALQGRDPAADAAASPEMLRRPQRPARPARPRRGHRPTRSPSSWPSTASSSRSNPQNVDELIDVAGPAGRGGRAADAVAVARSSARSWPS